MAVCFEEAPNAGDEHEPGSKTGIPHSKPHSEPIFIDMTEVDEGRGFAFFVKKWPHAVGQCFGFLKW